MRKTLSTFKIISDASNCPENNVIFNRFKNQYNLCLKRAKTIAYDQIILNSDSRSRDTWRLINKERDKTSIYNINNNISADEFVTYFSSVANVIVEHLHVTNTSETDFLKALPRN